MRRVRTGTSTRAIGQLPRYKQPAFAPDLHSMKALIESGNHAAKSLRKRDRLRLAQLGLAILANHRLAILIQNRRPRMVIRRVELASIGSHPPGVMHLVELVRLGFRARCRS